MIGIDPKQMFRLILVLSSVLAGLVAVTRSMVAPVDTTSGLSITVFALIVTVVGGLGNVVGALLAGIILGIINVFAADLIGSYISLIILLGAAAATILIRPAGLLGVKE
jgi:branched-subunit amino acid ABC-type transport system permease component